MVCNLKQKFKTCMESKKNNKGFTLVELIVVIVILAILIGVTIGGVFGYVNKSRINTDINNAAAIQSALSTLAVNKDMASYATSNDISDTKAIVIKWTKGSTVTGGDVKIGSATTDTIKARIDSILTDGFPDSKTNGYFKITIKDSGAKKGEVSVTCKAYSDEACNKPLVAAE